MLNFVNQVFLKI